MTDPTQPLTVMHGSPEWRQLVTRFWQCNGVTGDARDDHPQSPALLAKRKAAHERMMTALRNLDRKDAA